jgi:membrane protease YdiL (CAAX protease family)
MPAGQGIGARATWSIRDIVLGVVLAVASVILLQILFVVPVLAAGYDEDDSLTQGVAVISNLVWNVVLVLLVYWMAKRRGGSWASLGWRAPWRGERWSRWRLLGIVVGGYVCMWAVVGIYNLIVSLLGLDFLLPDEQIPEDIFNETWLVVLMGIAIVLGAPFSEELFFRGFLYGGLRRRRGTPIPALMTGSLFSLAHLQLGLIVPFTLIGAILSLVYERTGSIKISIALHLVFNGLSFMALVLIPEARG